jgi:catechol 2,3-dioxygenase-like lactoylglutathione lyase family enzyme
VASTTTSTPCGDAPLNTAEPTDREIVEALHSWARAPENTPLTVRPTAPPTKPVPSRATSCNSPLSSAHSFSAAAGGEWQTARMSSLGLATILVDDYDEAIAFFVNALRFELIEDTPSATSNGRAKRWVVVRPVGAETGILLARADTPAQAAAVGKQTPGRVGFFLHVDDFDFAHQHMSAAGVRFAEPPRDETYGKVAIFFDLAGNRWDLIEST